MLLKTSSFFFPSQFLCMVHLSDEILDGKLLKLLSSTLGQFPPVGIFDLEKRGLIYER